jgi:hypothetical protein
MGTGPAYESWHGADGKVTLMHRDVRMLRAQDAQEQPFAGGNEATV